MSKKTEPCPFCGSNDIKYEKTVEVFYCNTCGSSGPDTRAGFDETYPFENIPQIDAWNTRANLTSKCCGSCGYYKEYDLTREMLCFQMGEGFKNPDNGCVENNYRHWQPKEQGE